MPRRIVLHVGLMSAELTDTIDPEDIPDGWDEMSAEEKGAAMRPFLNVLIENEVNSWWTEEGE